MDIKDWRPDGWDIDEILNEDWVNQRKGADGRTMIEDACEAGADVMLKALREMGTRAGKFIHEDGVIKETPLIVIIPEDGEDNG